jgi:hypothetical protein
MVIIIIIIIIIQFRNFYSSVYFIGMIVKPRRLRWAGRVAWVGEIRSSTYGILVVKSLESGHLGDREGDEMTPLR